MKTSCSSESNLPDLFTDPGKTSLAESVGRITSRFDDDWRVQFALYKVRGVLQGERLIVAKYIVEAKGSATWFARIEVTDVFPTFCIWERRSNDPQEGWQWIRIPQTGTWRLCYPHRTF